MIREGKLISSFDANDLKHKKEKTFKLEFANNGFYEHYVKDCPKILKIVQKRPEQDQVFVSFNDADTDTFIEYTSNFTLNFCSEIKFTLEDYFMSFYEKGEK
ncbi:hypothetical protein [Enterococcus sp. DIV0876]|uniref:hypothetical protein n=1 Tax=Enterococcus sp. DIV0876 TaxID=2774633 RepID=UPI003D2FD854